MEIHNFAAICSTLFDHVSLPSIFSFPKLFFCIVPFTETGKYGRSGWYLGIGKLAIFRQLSHSVVVLFKLSSFAM